MKKILYNFSKLLYPQKKKCVLCDFEDSKNICSLCASSIRFIHGRRCLKCGKVLSFEYKENICPDCQENHYYFDSAFSCFEYLGKGKELIHKFKYYGKTECAMILSKYMRELIKKEGIKADIIVPVPIHGRKLKQRGFNQSYLIGKDLGKNISIPVWDCLIRSKDTKDQYNLDRIQRKINVIGAFSFNMLYNVRDKVIFLIDDVCTTNSTVNECSKVLIEYGAKKIYVITAAVGMNT